MTFSVEEASINCPYCGESQTVLIDCSQGDHEYIEDCQVCCRPIIFNVYVEESGENGGEFSVLVRHENE